MCQNLAVYSINVCGYQSFTKHHFLRLNFLFWSEPLVADLSARLMKMFCQGLKWQPLIMCFCDMVYTQRYSYAYTVSPDTNASLL